jgi:hypothetical protein
MLTYDRLIPDTTSNPGRGRGFSSSPTRPDWLWGSPSLQSGKYQVSFPGIELQGREADHSSLSGAEVKNQWRHNFTLSVAWTGTSLVLTSNDSVSGRVCRPGSFKGEENLKLTTKYVTMWREEDVWNTKRN